MFTLIEDVKVLRPFYRLQQTGPNDRPLKGPALFGEGVDTINLFTFAASNGVFFRGIEVDKTYRVTTITYQSKLYFADFFNDPKVKLTLGDSNLYDHKLESVLNKPIYAIVKEALEEYAYVDSNRMIIKMPRIIDNCNRTKWLGLLSKPVWTKE